jgi:uncharacterized membrane protein YphA (DoxX/SURF4 family)
MIKNVFSNGYFTLASRVLLGFVFIIASIEKITLPDEFAVAVQAYQILPLQAINLFALIVPWIELLCGIFILSGVCVRSSSTIVSLMLAGFITAISMALYHHLNIDCGCFGAAHAQPVGWQKIAEDVGLGILSVNLAVHPRSMFALMA